MRKVAVREVWTGPNAVNARVSAKSYDAGKVSHREDLPDLPTAPPCLSESAMQSVVGVKTSLFAQIRTSPFVRYAFNHAFICDISALDMELMHAALLFLTRLPFLSTIRLRNSNKHYDPKAKMKQGVVPTPNARSLIKGHNLCEERHRKVNSLLHVAVLKQAPHLLHLELVGIKLKSYKPLMKSLQSCAHLSRLYFKHCNVGDKALHQLSTVLETLCVNHLTVSSCELTEDSGPILARLIEVTNIPNNPDNHNNVNDPNLVFG